MPKHLAILVILLGCFFLLALSAKFYLTDPSFYRFGNYRADAVPELASGTPLFRGGEYCRTCHSDGFAFGSGIAHSSVQCEVCHGTDPGHPDNPEMSVPAETIKLCTNCHQAMPARPAGHPQILMAEHPSPDEAGMQCHSCHDPHSPGGGEAVAGAADTGSEGAVPADSSVNLPDAVSKCARCHGQFGEGRKNNPAIAGMDSSAFVELMIMYASGVREHKAMNRYASELSTEEIAELSRYYEHLAAQSPE